MAFDIYVGEIERLQKALQNFQGDAEKVINSILHKEGSLLIQENIRKLMPTSDPADAWVGKLPHAKFSESLTDQKEHLAITVKSTNEYHYLYFPDDGSNTRNHVGNKQFFLRGAEASQDEIIDLCVSRLVNGLENLT